MWVIGILFILLIAVFEAAHRKSVSESTNLRLNAAGTPYLKYRDGAYCISDERGRRAHMLIIRNDATEKGTKTANITAQLVKCVSPKRYPISPLSWVGTRETTVKIGPAETKELIVAMREDERVLDNQTMWNYVCLPFTSSQEMWIEWGKSGFEIQFINSETGRLVPVYPRLCFTWEWPEGEPQRDPQMELVPESPLEKLHGLSRLRKLLVFKSRSVNEL